MAPADTSNPSPTSPAHRRQSLRRAGLGRLGRGRRPGVWLAAGTIACSMVWLGCSIEKNYSTLSFFFDGVPDPAAKARAAAAAGITDDIRKSPTYTLHKPYAEEQCAACHKGQLTITGRDSTMCMGCHRDEPTKHPRMHGPVAAGACLWCHAPHESAEAHLMRKGSREICMQCHDKSLLRSDGVPEHADDTKSCLQCHYGHGGNSAMFLKEGVSRLAPRPAAGPSKDSGKAPGEGAPAAPEGGPRSGVQGATPGAAAPASAGGAGGPPRKP